MDNVVRFTLEEIKALNFFEPQAALDTLNDLLGAKINIVVERMRQTYCKHDSVGYEMIKEQYICNNCGRVWR